MKVFAAYAGNRIVGGDMDNMDSMVMVLSQQRNKRVVYYYKRNGVEVNVMAEYNGKMIMAPLFFSDAEFTKPLDKISLNELI